MKKVLFVIAHEGFQPIEYGTPKQILTDAGVEVTTASDRGGTAVSSITQEKAPVDLTLEKAKAEDYDGVFFAGGPGASEHLENEPAYNLARQAQKLGKAYGAICYSTRVLAHAGVLKDKKATGWDADGELGGILDSAGAEYIHEPVVADGKLATAVGPKAAEEWGRKILEIL